jgi:dTDP-4-amino-4,6-dideoxygalactose transaminase
VKTFGKSFTQQEPISESAISRAVAVLRSGRLHRYNTAPGEASEVELLEREFADYIGLPYCLACASGGYALHIALRSVGLAAGEPVLCNAFTLSPVPGAIHNAGGRPVLVETGEDCTVDLDDLGRAAAESGARVFLLSHMRGHIADMEAVIAICREHELTLIEDCAHTMGAKWNGRMSGTFGAVACFSTQTYKHINSGEGGLLVTTDAEIMRRAVIHSGSYMFYDRHPAAPPPDTFSQARLEIPNYSGRMDNLRAAILRPQIPELDERRQRWAQLYATLESGLGSVNGIRVPPRSPREAFVGSSIQFSLPGVGPDDIREFLAACEKRGVMVKWFGDPDPKGYTSRHESWAYIRDPRSLPRTQELLATLCDMRIPLTFDVSDCETIVEIVSEAFASVRH